MYPRIKNTVSFSIQFLFFFSFFNFLTALSSTRDFSSLTTDWMLEPTSLAFEVPILSHWITREVPSHTPFLTKIFLFLLAIAQSAMSDSLWPHRLQHVRLPCPSPSPGVSSNSCPLSWWCHPTISSSVIPFSRLQSFPASGCFPMSQFFASSGQSTGTSAQHQSLQWIFRVDFL